MMMRKRIGRGEQSLGCLSQQQGVSFNGLIHGHYLGRLVLCWRVYVAALERCKKTNTANFLAQRKLFTQLKQHSGVRIMLVLFPVQALDWDMSLLLLLVRCRVAV